MYSTPFHFFPPTNNQLRDEQLREEWSERRKEIPNERRDGTFDRLNTHIWGKCLTRFSPVMCKDAMKGKTNLVSQSVSLTLSSSIDELRETDWIDDEREYMKKKKAHLLHVWPHTRLKRFLFSVCKQRMISRYSFSRRDTIDWTRTKEQRRNEGHEAKREEWSIERIMFVVQSAHHHHHPDYQGTILTLGDMTKGVKCRQHSSLREFSSLSFSEKINKCIVCERKI